MTGVTGHASGRLVLVLALGLLGLTSGCSGSALIWYGHTPDRARPVELRQAGGLRWLRVGTRSSARYRVVATSSIVFGPNGRWAFAAARADGLGRQRWHVVTRHGEGAAWDGVAELGFSPSAGTLVYAARSRGRWRVVVDGRAQGPWDGIVEGSIAFSPDGARVGYLALRGECVVPVIDGVAGSREHDVVGFVPGAVPSRDAILARPSARDEGELSIGGRERSRFPSPRGLWVEPSSGRWAVIAAGTGAQESPGWRLVVDGEPGPRVDDIDHVTWAPGGGEIAYAARTGSDWFVVRERGGARLETQATRSEPFLHVEAPVFSGAVPRHLAFIGRTRTHSEIVLDGRTVWSAPAEATALAFDPGGERIAWIYRDDSGMIVAVGDDRFRFDVVIEHTLRFTADGRHWAALVGGRKPPLPRKLFIVVDGTLEIPFDAAELFGGGLGARSPEEGLGDWVAAELSRHFQGSP